MVFYKSTIHPALLFHKGVEEIAIRFFDRIPYEVFGLLKERELLWVVAIGSISAIMRKQGRKYGNLLEDLACCSSH
jgi:hypothetical protein